MKYKKIFYVFIFLIFLISINFYVVTHLSKTNNYFVHKVKSLIPQSSRDFLKKFNSDLKEIVLVFNNNKKLKSKIQDRNIKIYDRFYKNI